ncbi:MAG: ribosome maturation factor RimM [Acidimicrobiales bacterium]|nr:ribosome maturation factor RimM [Acidimicrobiales bacterium]
MLEVGRITRPHGVRGDVNVLLTSNRTERVAKGSVLHTEDGPLTVRSSRPHKSGFIVTFAECTSRERAEELRDTILRAEPIDDPDELWVHELIGATVVDGDGIERGRVTQVLENPASDILETDAGHLVPVQFVTDIDPGVRVDVDTPAGLFDLDDDGEAGR